MLELEVLGEEYFDEKDNIFVTVNDTSLKFEHSLASLALWEEKYEKPFLDSKDKTQEEMFYYIKCMLLTPDISDEIIFGLSEHDIKELISYIESKRTATTFSQTEPKRGNSEIITSELIYCWMTLYNIPFTCETWNLNRLLTLIRVCGLKSSPPKKMSKRALAEKYHDLNAKRLAERKTQ